VFTVNDIQSSPLPVSQRSAAFARLASRVLEALNNAVDIRRAEGQTLSSIAAKIGRDRSALTRALNGTSSNLTIRTISDILWATNFDPRDFEADPIESISPNWIDSSSSSDCETKITPYPTIPVKMSSDYIASMYSASRFNKPEVSVVAQ
jgi:DNA-binding phage protein